MQCCIASYTVIIHFKLPLLTQDSNPRRHDYMQSSLELSSILPVSELTADNLLTKVLFSLFIAVGLFFFSVILYPPNYIFNMSGTAAASMSVFFTVNWWDQCLMSWVCVMKLTRLDLVSYHLLWVDFMKHLLLVQDRLFTISHCFSWATYMKHTSDTSELSCPLVEMLTNKPKRPKKD